MTKEVLLAQKKDRLSSIENKGKSTGGVQKKLRREIRNLQK